MSYVRVHARRSAIVVFKFLLVLSMSVGQTQAQPANQGLIVRYDFDETEGQVVHDRGGVGQPLDLKIRDAGAVRWRAGGLVIESPTLIASEQPAKKITDAIRKSNAVTVEAWLTPKSDSQSGPARIVSLSSDTSRRNVTLGQDGDKYDLRLRTTGSDDNGLPSTASPKKTLATHLTYVVATRDAQGKVKLYIDGANVAGRDVGGNLSNWDAKTILALANEASRDRPWLGTLHFLAIYDRALSESQITQKYKAGADDKTPAAATTASKSSPKKGSPPPAEMAKASASTKPPASTGNTQHFDQHVAALLAKNCLECHDSAIKKGGLDLSRQAAAMAGGESGRVIVPGNAKESLLWQAVASGEMPKDRAPLTAEEKQALQKWLDGGAAWSVAAIDPVLYTHAGSTELWVQRLTTSEYIETVRAAVGVDISKEARELLPPDLRADGFSNTAYNLKVDLKHIEAYSQLAAIIVERMDVLEFAGRFSKSQNLSTDDTMRDHVAAMGKWLLRGPLDKRDINVFSGIATTVASSGGDFKEAMGYIIEAMLQSPRFIYRIEQQRGGGSSQAVEPYALASRMSYIVWGAPPDEALLRAADKGELSNRQQVEAQLQRMLKDPRTKQRSAEFITQWLDLDRLANLRPNAKRFPNWDAQLAADMRAETLAYFDEVVWQQNRPLSDLLNAQLTFATPQLAKHYGLKPSGKTLVKYDLSQQAGRGGLLTQGSVLTVGGDDASMVSRGLFVLHDLLRGTINAPPPCVNTTPPPTKSGLTQRGIAEARIADETCGVCHSRFEPLAFGLERFDGVGAYHQKDEHGNPLKEDGAVLFPGEAQPVKYTSSAELMDLLAGHERVQQSLTWKVTQFSLGRPLLARDAATVNEIHQAAHRGGGTYSSLITAIVLSDLVQTTRTEKE